MPLNYKLTYTCSNCGNIGIKEFKFGVVAKQTASCCDNCGTQSLEYGIDPELITWKIESRAATYTAKDYETFLKIINEFIEHDRV